MPSVTSLLRLRLRRLYQLDKMPLAYPKRVVAPGYLDPRHPVVVHPDHLTSQDDGIAYRGGVSGVRGSFSHAEYVEHHSKEAR